ncbi:MAG: hypothetical protein RLN88_04100 [Ekhidna sp.]|uniref:hypothetical protein n=1 Tax=Ekhidna sp. TaxID=2608089 RepID=UPI0032ECC2E0
MIQLINRNLLLIIMSGNICLAQFGGKKITEGTFTIDNYELTVGDTLKLGYGSSSTGDFVFIHIYYGSVLSGSAVPKKMPSSLSDGKIVLDHFRYSKKYDLYAPVFRYLYEIEPNSSFPKVWVFPQLRQAIFKEELYYR